MRKSRGSPPQSLDTELKQLDERHRALLHELAEIGPVLRGSISSHWMRCGQPTCRCQRDPEARHGPYSQWTRKVAGKTVSVKLSPEQAKRCREWTANMRRFDRVAKKIQGLGLQAVQALRAAKPHDS